MKQFKDLKDEQVKNLTSEELERHVKLGLLEEGIKIPTKPQAPVYEAVPEEDVTAYSVSKVSGFFKNREDAEEVAELLSNKVNQMGDVSYSDSSKVLREYFKSYEGEGFVVSAKKFYSPELYKDISNKIKANNELKKNYEQELKEYNQQVEDAQWVRDEVYNRYQDVVDKFYKLEEMRRKYLEYVDLAGKDKKQAMIFFKKAYPVSYDEEQYVLTGVLPSHTEADNSVEAPQVPDEPPTDSES